MSENNDLRNAIESETLWVAAQGENNIDIRGDQLRATFEIRGDQDVRVRLRASNVGEEKGVASVTFELSALI